MCVTETWLTGTPRDNAPIAAVKPPGYEMKHVPRTSRKGGGVGMIYREDCTVKLIKSSTYRSFEHMTAQVVSGSSLYHISVIYHPPPSVKNKLTFALFMDEFPRFLADAVMTSGQLLIIGDFNIHVNSESRESKQFTSLLHTYNLTQHVTSPTYRRGRVLDLVITRTDAGTISDILVTDPMISDHSAVIITLPTSSLISSRENNKIPKLQKT